MNQDGWIDILGLAPEAGEVSIVLNRAAPGEFAPPVNLPVGENPRSFAVADLAGSDALDLAILVDSETPGGREVRTYRGEVLEGAVSYSTGPAFGVQPGASLLLAADLTGSESADLLTLGGQAAVGAGAGLPQTRVEALLQAVAGVEPCPGDANGDRIVNFADLNTVLAAFGSSGPGIPGDVTGDGVVNFADLNLVLSRFGQECP